MSEQTRKAKPISRSKKRHVKQHGLRGASLTRIAEKAQLRAEEIQPKSLDPSQQTTVDMAVAKSLAEIAAIFRISGRSEPKLR